MRKMGIEYRPAALTSGETMEVGAFWHPTVDAWSPVYRDMLEPFNASKYTAPRLPVDLGRFDISAARQCPSVLRMPLKKAGETSIAIPKELLPMKEEILRVCQYDRHVTPGWENFHIHLTVDNSVVAAGTTQRFPGFHGDGLQGGKFKQKLTCEHSYIACDPVGTVVAMQPFFVAHLNEDRVNIFKEFDRQVKKESLYSLREGHLYLIDPYVVHTSPICQEETLRTFVRITVTPAELLMPKNTVNPMLPGQVYAPRIEVREFVSDPDEEIPFSWYGLGG